MNCIRFYKRLLFAVVILLAATVQKNYAQSIYAYGYTFSAFSKPYTYLSGGTPVTAIQVDDNYATIPIGFTFTYCGVDYTDVTVCSNGWLRFGTGPGAAPSNWNYNPTPSLSPYPAVYFLYEDITGDYATASYKVTGTAPNRMFTFEFKNIAWDFQSTSPCVSAQVNLYETTGVIECLYKKETGSVALNSSGGATVGIHNTLNDYQVLNNTTTAPVASSSVWTSTIAATPVTDQCYKWDPGPVCQVPTGLAITNLASKSVAFNWSGSAGSYEYIVDQNSGNPTVAGTNTTVTNATVSALTPSTNYYIHLRAKCSSVSFSKWTTLPFTTRPTCATPGRITVIQVDTSSVTLQWPLVLPAVNYQYIINKDRSTPVNAVGASNTTTPTVSQVGLTEGTWYYIHYRSQCLGNDSSAWALDSFRTPVPCRRPNIALTYLSNSNSVTNWSAVNTAVQYEYYLGPVSSLPPNGTPILTTYIQTPYLVPSTAYTINVRCICNDYGAKSVSPWASLDFTTPPPTSVGAVLNDVKLVVFPNPAKDNIVISAIGLKLQNANLTIYDLSGRIIKALKADDNTIGLDVSGLAKGVYVVKLADVDGTYNTKLVIE